MKRFILLLTFVVLLASFASAGNMYNINLVDQNEIPIEGEAYVYVCTDDTCSAIDTTYPVEQINSVDSVISYEGLGLQTKKSYGMFIYSEGKLPYAVPFFNDSLSGNTLSATIPLSQKDICYAPIISTTVINDAVEYEPIQINVSAALNTEVASAFRKANFPPSFEPNEARAEKEDFWSAHTKVTVIITDGNGDEHTITDSANIFSDETEEFSFTWIPKVEGETTVEFIATVDDEQCATSEPFTDSTTFTVLKDLSDSFYHAFIFDANKPGYPVANEDFNVTFDTVSYFYNNGTYDATPTEISYAVFEENGAIIQTDSFIISKIDAQTFQEVAIELNLPAGEYDIQINATADNYTYDVPRNDASVTLDIIIEEPRYDLSIMAIDALTTEGISSAKVEVNSYIQFTATQGDVIFRNLFTGNKEIEITKDGFIPETDSISLTSDMSRTYTLQRTTCNDGIDNDGDGFIDYPNDPDCLSINDQENRDDTPEEELYSLTINVIDGFDNSPLENADIVFEGQSFTTPNNGTVSFDNLNTDNYTLSIQKFGWIGYGPNIFEVDDNLTYTITLGRTTCNDGIDNENDGFVDLADPECSTIDDSEGAVDNSNEYDLNFTVLDASNSNPITIATINFNGNSYGTNSNGMVMIDDVQADNYTYTVSAQGYESQSNAIEITEDTRSDIYLVPVNVHPNTYDFSLTVLDASTTDPIGGVYVEFGGANFLSNNNGIVSLENLSAGNYSYEASLIGYTTATGVYEITQDTTETLYLVPENNQIEYDLFATPIVESYNESSDVIICQDNFATGYNTTQEVPVTVLLNGVQQSGIQSLTFGNPVRECLNFGMLQNGTYTVIQTIDPFNQFLDDDRSNNLFQYTFIVGPSNNGGGDNNGGSKEESKSEVPHIGITAFDFFAIDYSKATELDQIQIGLTNDGDFKMENIVITLSIPELAVWDRVRINELYVGETEYDYLHLGVYDEYEPGYYNLRVSVMTNSGYSRARWYEVWLE